VPLPWTNREGAELEAALVGRFLLGMVSGGLLVTGGLVVGAMMFPTKAANDNVVTPAAVEEKSVAPDATTPEAGAKVATADPAPAPVPEVEPAKPATTAAETEPTPPAAPVVANADVAPEAPKGDATAPMEPVAPAAEVAKPATAAEPVKPEESQADAAAIVPDPAPAATAAPEAAAEGTKLAAADPAPAVKLPEAVTEAAPAAVAEAPATAAPTPTPAETTPAAPASDVTPAETATPTTEEPATTAAAPAVTEPATETAVAQAPAVEPVPETAAPVVEPPAPAAPEGEVPAVETETATTEAPAVEAPAVEPPAEVAVEPEPAAPEAVPEALPETLPETMIVPETAEQDMPGTKPAALPGVVDETGDQPKILVEGEGTGPTFKPAPGLIRSGEGVIIGRGTDETAEAAPADGTAPVDPRPIAQFAAPFENPDSKPALAIVLVDDGSAELDRAGLAALPFPVSFALDPLDPATPDHAAIYRAAGREVVMIATGIAQGAQASDVEVAFQSMEQNLPEAVAVMDLPAPAFQNNRTLSSSVVSILKAGGRGLLTWDEGLNAADQVARREDLEAAVVFRDLDQAKGDAVAVRRLMDRAVFKAGQDGRVSVVGTADPATVAALLEWTVEGKAATVALAPLTAVLKVD
jgi:uncharacterized protein